MARLPAGFCWVLPPPPPGIQVRALLVGGGFQIGWHIYDCVYVMNSREALSAYTNARVSLGSDLAVVAGPCGAGGAVDLSTAAASSSTMSCCPARICSSKATRCHVRRYSGIKYIQDRQEASRPPTISYREMLAQVTIR